jgi:hypothetical protein
MLLHPVSGGGLPKEVTSVLSSLEKADIPVIPGLVKQLESKLEKVESNYYAKSMKLGNLQGTWVAYQPPKQSKYLFAAVFQDISLETLGLETGPLDQVSLSPVVFVYSLEDMGTLDVHDWPGTLGKDLKGLAPPSSSKSAKLRFDKGVNVFLRLGKGSSDELSKLFEAVGLEMNQVTAEVRRGAEPKENEDDDPPAKKPASAELMVWGTWKEPFRLANASFKDVTILVDRDEQNNKTFEAWGDFTLAGNSYFLWGAETAGLTRVGRAFGLAASKLGLDAITDFADAMPVFSQFKLGSAVASKLPLNKVKILNENYKSHARGEYPDSESFIVFYASEDEPVAHTGKKGPLFEASGEAQIFAWKATSLQADIDPENKKLHVVASMGTPKLDSLPMAKAAFNIDVDVAKKQFDMGMSGEYDFEDFRVADARLEISKDRVELAVDTGCIPPMLKATIHEDFDGSIPKPSVKASSCAKQIGEDLEAAAKAVGHVLDDAMKHVASAVGRLADKIKGDDESKTTNEDVPLYQTAARHMMRQRTLDDMKERGVDKVNITSIVLDDMKIPWPFPGALPEVWATRKVLEDQLKDIHCQAEGRIAQVLDMKDDYEKQLEDPSKKDAAQRLIEMLKAELHFYQDFKDRVSDVDKVRTGGSKDEKKDLQACRDG